LLASIDRWELYDYLLVCGVGGLLLAIGLALCLVCYCRRRRQRRRRGPSSSSRGPGGSGAHGGGTRRKRSTLQMAVLERKVSSYANLESSNAPTATSLAEWEELVDDVSGERYWYNHSTAETTWVQPDELRQPRSAQAPTGLPTSSLLGLPPPPGLPTSSIVGLPLGLPLPPPPAPPPATPPVALPAGWEVHEDDTTGAVYFFNPVTGATQWEKPTV